MQQPPKLLTTKQAAAYLGVAEITLRRWRSEGNVRLPFVRIGGRVRYSRAALEKYVEKNMVR